MFYNAPTFEIQIIEKAERFLSVSEMLQDFSLLRQQSYTIFDITYFTLHYTFCYKTHSKYTRALQANANARLFRTPKSFAR